MEIIPLHNHAHDPFAHLPNNYVKSSHNWSVIVPVIMAVLTVVAILVALACIVHRR